EDGIRDYKVTGVQTCALPISARAGAGDPRLAAPRRAPDRCGDPTRERDAGRDLVRAGGDERLDERAAADGAADHDRGERRRGSRSEERRVGKEGGSRWDRERE